MIKTSFEAEKKKEAKSQSYDGERREKRYDELIAAK